MKTSACTKEMNETSGSHVYKLPRIIRPRAEPMARSWQGKGEVGKEKARVDLDAPLSL
jgi:hypothetical protein